MSDFKFPSILPKRHTLLPVVHAEDTAQVLRNIGIAHDSGADGVFLINHSVGPEELLRMYAAARKQYPQFWMGLNLLGLSPLHALERMPDDANGLWADNASITDHGALPKAIQFAAERASQPKWKGLYFGGVAFKGQEHVEDPALAAKLALPFVDVVTTSGIGTGFAPDVDKIKRMKQAIRKHPLAIASGITPENAQLFMPWADCFLVATGISDSHTEFNRERMARLVKILS